MNDILPTRSHSTLAMRNGGFPPFGQCKRAHTILAEQGDCVYVINDVPCVRRRHKPAVYYKGRRAMHETTLRMPTQSFSTYNTTSNYFHGGKLELPAPERRTQFVSQQMSQVVFGADENNKWLTKYTWDYPSRDPAPPRVLHYPEQVNKLNMTEGGDVRQVMHTTDRQGRGSTFTQYNRVHNKLGAALGPGVAKEYPVREQYNPITGESRGNAWSAENKRTSGNRILYNGYRREATDHFALG